MSEFAVNCTVNISSTGKPACGLDAGRVVGHILCTQGTEFATGALAKVLANWTTLIQANTAYPIPLSWKQEYAQNEEQEATGSGGKTKVLYSLVGRDKFFIPYDILTNDYVANLKSLNNGTWGIFTIHENGYIGGKSSDGTKFQAIDADIRILSRNKATDEDGGDIPYTVQLDSVDDVDLFGQHVKPTDFNPKTDLDGLLDVDIVVSGTPTASELILVLDTVLNDVVVTDFVIDDFLLLKASDSSEQAPDSLTEAVDGTYVLVTTGGVSGTASLQIPSAMTTEGFKSAGAISYSIS